QEDDLLDPLPAQALQGQDQLRHVLVDVGQNPESHGPVLASGPGSNLPGGAPLSTDGWTRLPFLLGIAQPAIPFPVTLLPTTCEASPDSAVNTPGGMKKPPG